MLGKLLLLALAVWLLVFILGQYRRNIDRTVGRGPEAQDMVRCRVCGVHLPKSESVMVNGNHYCCEEHSRQSAQ
jgi:uncharacterized protein